MYTLTPASVKKKHKTIFWNLTAQINPTEG